MLLKRKRKARLKRVEFMQDRVSRLVNSGNVGLLYDEGPIASHRNASHLHAPHKSSYFRIHRERDRNAHLRSLLSSKRSESHGIRHRARITKPGSYESATQ